MADPSTVAADTHGAPATLGFGTEGKFSHRWHWRLPLTSPLQFIAVHCGLPLPGNATTSSPGSPGSPALSPINAPTAAVPTPSAALPPVPSTPEAPPSLHLVASASDASTAGSSEAQRIRTTSAFVLKHFKCLVIRNLFSPISDAMPNAFYDIETGEPCEHMWTKHLTPDVPRTDPQTFPVCFAEDGEVIYRSETQRSTCNPEWRDIDMERYIPPAAHNATHFFIKVYASFADVQGGKPLLLVDMEVELGAISNIRAWELPITFAEATLWDNGEDRNSHLVPAGKGLLRPTVLDSLPLNTVLMRIGDTYFTQQRVWQLLVRGCAALLLLRCPTPSSPAAVLLLSCPQEDRHHFTSASIEEDEDEETKEGGVGEVWTGCLVCCSLCLSIFRYRVQLAPLQQGKSVRQ